MTLITEEEVLAAFEGWGLAIPPKPTKGAGGFPFEREACHEFYEGVPWREVDIDFLGRTGSNDYIHCLNDRSQAYYLPALLRVIVRYPRSSMADSIVFAFSRYGDGQQPVTLARLTETQKDVIRRAFMFQLQTCHGNDVGGLFKEDFKKAKNLYK